MQLVQGLMSAVVFSTWRDSMPPSMVYLIEPPSIKATGEKASSAFMTSSLATPPISPLSDRETLEKDVRGLFTPQALFGGEDGLACYRILANDIKRLLTPNGLAVLEFGFGQRPEIENIILEDVRLTS